jgi:hypothetical protein
MSAFSNRALYRGGATNHGRVQFSPSTGRVLYAGPSWISCSERKYLEAYVEVNGGSAWTQANYEQCQDDAEVALRAASSWSTDASGAWSKAPSVKAGCWNRFSEDAYASEHCDRWTFALPSGKRGDITKVRLRAACAAGYLWDSASYGSYYNYANSTLDDMGCSLLFYFSESATAYSDGQDLLDGTPTVSMGFDDINDIVAAAGLSLRTGALAADSAYYPEYSRRPYIIMNLDAAASTINAFSSDTIYLWVAILRPNYLPYVYEDPGDTAPLDYTKDFLCEASCSHASLAITTT